MNTYLATFHTHYAAMKSMRNLSSAGISARLAPVPRSVSASCGTCLIYTASTEMEQGMDADYEHIYQTDPGGMYIVVASNRLQ